jgi:hypothetical protein
LDSITNRPVLIYDDKCSSCTVFAKYAFKYSRGQINCIGHYSKEGQKLRKFIFPPNYNETEMFWLIKENRAFGGRSGLFQLLVLILRAMPKPKNYAKDNSPKYCANSEDCRNKMHNFKRLYNLLRNGKKLNIKIPNSTKY